MRFTEKIAPLFCILSMVSPAWSAEPVTRIWLTHPVSDASQLMVNWETEQAGPSKVVFGPSPELGEVRESSSAVTLHQIAIPFPASGTLHYRVASGESTSPIHAVRTYSDDTLRVALAADWQTQPDLRALLAEEPHLLVACGDVVRHLINLEKLGDLAYTKPFSALVGRYPRLFATVPFMPALGNHDRQLRPRMFEPLVDPTYDIEATTHGLFFPLPGDGWKWHFDVPGFDIRFLALDLSHISDRESNWQSCHPFDETSAQFTWYRDLMAKSNQRFVVTVYNEQHRQVRAQNGGAWGELIQQGTTAITGFGYFAERAEVDGFPYFNTALKAGDIYADRGNTKFLEKVATYVLLTVPRDGDTMMVAFKGLDGKTLDETSWKGR
jgi:hypothetical protein